MEFVEWLVMYQNTHRGTERMEWPNGGSYLTQHVVLLDVWAIITDEILKYRKEQQ